MRYSGNEFHVCISLYAYRKPYHFVSLNLEARDTVRYGLACRPVNTAVHVSISLTTYRCQHFIYWVAQIQRKIGKTGDSRNLWLELIISVPEACLEILCPVLARRYYLSQILFTPHKTLWWVQPGTDTRNGIKNPELNISLSVIAEAHKPVSRNAYDSSPGRMQKQIIYWPRQANLVLIAYASSEGSGEPAHRRSLVRTSAARSYKQWVKRNLQTESQIPGPSEWLGMRS